MEHGLSEIVLGATNIIFWQKKLAVLSLCLDNLNVK